MNEDVKEIFIDGVSSMNFLNGMVRVGMGTMVPTNSDDPNATPPFNEKFRLIMPLNAFLASYNSYGELVKKLEENGVIARQEQNEVIPETAK